MDIFCSHFNRPIRSPEGKFVLQLLQKNNLIDYYDVFEDEGLPAQNVGRRVHIRHKEPPHPYLLKLSDFCGKGARVPHDEDE